MSDHHKTKSQLINELEALRAELATLKHAIAHSSSSILEPSKDNSENDRARFLHQVLDSLFTFVAVLSPDGIVLEANEAHIAITGLTREEVIGKPFAESYWWAYDPEVQTKIWEAIAQAKQERFVRFDIPVRVVESNFIIIDLLLMPIFDTSGQVSHLIASGLNINDRKQSELSLTQSRDLRTTIYNESTDAIFLIDPENWLIVDCNYRAMQMFEATSKESLIGVEEHTLQKQRFTNDEMKVIAEEIQHSSFWSQEIEYITQKGNYFWGNLAVKRINIADKAMNLVRVTDISNLKHAEQELRNLSDHLKLAIDSAQIGIWEWDIVNDHLIWDDRMYELYGIKPPEFLGAYQAWEQGVHPDDRAMANNAIEQALKGEKEYDLEFRVMHHDRTTRVIKANAIVQRNSQGEPQRMIGVNYDISDRKQTEKMLELQAVVTRNMAEGICLVRADNGIIVYANPKFEQMFGYEQNELNGQHVAIVNYASAMLSAEDVSQAIRAAVVERGEYTYEVHNVKKDGTSFWCSAIASIFNHPDYGDVLVAVHQDISDRKRVEIELHQLNAELEQRIAERTTELSQINDRLQQELSERERLQLELMQREQLLNGFFNAASAANIGLSIHDRDLSYIQINQVLADVNGLPIEAHLGRTCNELMPEIAATLVPVIQSVIDTGQAIDRIEVSGVTLSQSRSLRYWLVSFFPIFGEANEVIAVGEIVLEITERKQIEEALRQSEERLRLALDFNHIGFWDLDLLTGKVAWNDNQFTLLGLIPNMIEPSYQAWRERIHPEDRERVEGLFAHSLEARIDYEAEYRVVYPDGSVHWVLGRGKAIYDDLGTPVRSLGVVLDINDRKQAEEAVKLSEEKYRQIVNTACEGIWVLDEQGNSIFVNPQMAEMLGYSVEEMMSQSLFAFMDAEWQVIAASKMESRRQGVTERHDFKFRRKDGEDLWCIISTNPILDEAGQFIGALGMVTDISDRKHAEESIQNINQQLEDRVNELKQRNAEMLMLSEISDFLQSCLTVQEACATIATLARPLFPDCAGGIFTIANSRNHLEMATSWGNSLCSESIFSPQDCWALRRGRMHWVGNDQQDLLCNHTDHQNHPAESLCIPMIAQGETIGLLYLCATTPNQLTEIRQQLARTISEQLSLAIANLTLRETLQNQSIRDPLTGLFNRRYLEEFLETEIYRAQRNYYSVGVIMLDIDHFKRFNDTLGHEAGDVVLQELGNLLKLIVRSSDVVCRYGGEEMTIILPESSMEETYQKAEELREAIANLKFKHKEKMMGSITASLGVACFPDQGMTGNAVIQAADAALYRAKAAGRNQVIAAIR